MLTAKMQRVGRNTRLNQGFKFKTVKSHKATSTTTPSYKNTSEPCENKNSTERCLLIYQHYSSGSSFHPY